MGGEWRKVKLEEVSAEITVGYVGSMTSEYTNSGVPFLRSKNVDPLNINTDDIKFISSEFNEKIKKSMLSPGDVVIVRTGKPGTCAVIPDWLESANCSDLVIVRCGPELNNRYLSYYVNTVAASHVNAHLVGAVQQHFNVGSAKLMELDLPPLPYQEAVIGILGALDDKIELNRQMNATLESMAQALFKSWFVDFDPVIDNALAAGNEIPPELQARAEKRQALLTQAASQPDAPLQPLPADLRALFPASFVLNEELGWVPEGWEITEFQKIADVIMGQSPHGDTYNEIGDGVPLVNGPVEFGYYFTEKSKWTTAPSKLSSKGDLVVCVRGSTTGRFVKSNDVYCLGRGVCAVRGKYSQAYVDLTFKNNIERLLQLTTGSTFPNWSGPTLKSFSALFPNRPVLAAFDSQVKTWVERIESNVEQMMNLASLRDLLLPKLLSGQIQLPEAEQQLAEAL